jgi:hypothetical protein
MRHLVIYYEDLFEFPAQVRKPFCCPILPATHHTSLNTQQYCHLLAMRGSIWLKAAAQHCR